MATPVYKPRPAHWPTWRFSLRTLFLLVTLLGIFLGWLGAQAKWIRDRHEAFTHHFPNQISSWTSDNPDPQAPWRIGVLGEPGVSLLWLDPSLEPSERERLQELFPEALVEVKTEPSR